MSTLAVGNVSRRLVWALGICLASLVAPAAAQEEPESNSDPYAAENYTYSESEPAAEESAPPEQAAVEPIPVQTDEPAAAPGKTGQATQLDDITVTARKRVESIQEVPVSVTAFNASEMDRRGFAGLEDLARATPGFTFEPYMTGGAHGAPVMRGLAQTFTTARIQNVSFFINGVYLQRQSMIDVGMIDLERIELMKGPQNALYGRNAFAGAVNYITQEPTPQTEGYLLAGSGDNDRQEFRVSLTGSLNEAGTVYGKFTAGQRTYDGHTPNMHPVANANPPGENLRGNLGGYEDETYSMSLVYEPLDNLKLRGNYYYSDFIHETSPGYSISGVHAARFDLRLDDENDLNCLPGTVADIGQPQITHSGFSAWCGELPNYASDANFREVKGMVVDPRAIGSLSTTGLITMSADYEFNGDLSGHYVFGTANHESYTDGGASDEDPVHGRGILVNATGPGPASDPSNSTQNPDNYVFANTASGRPNSVLTEFAHELRFDWTVNDRLRTSFGGYHSKVQDEEWTSLFISDLCNGDRDASANVDGYSNYDHCNMPISAPNHIAEQTESSVGVAYDQYARQSGGKLRGEWTAFEDTINAVFGSATYGITETLEGTIEARYSVENKVIDRLTDAFMLAPGESVDYSDQLQPNGPLLPIPGTYVLTSTIVVPHDEAKFTDITPRLILNWDWAAGHMAYFSVAKGVKAGGFNNSSVAAEQSYEPETNRTYEIGSKNRFFHGIVTANAALYYINWDNLQGQTPPQNVSLSSSDFVNNIGGASSRGVEFEGMAHLTRALSVDLGFSYSDPKYDDGVRFAAAVDPDGDSSNTADKTQKIICDDVRCNSNGDVGGNQLARTSKIQYTGGINYILDFSGWTLTSRLDTNYQSKQFVEPTNLAWLPERMITNASLKVNFPDYHWELNTWVKNLTDLDYAANSFYIGVFDQYMVGKGAPRTFGLTLKYKF